MAAIIPNHISATSGKDELTLRHVCSGEDVGPKDSDASAKWRPEPKIAATPLSGKDGPCRRIGFPADDAITAPKRIQDHTEIAFSGNRRRPAVGAPATSHRPCTRKRGTAIGAAIEHERERNRAEAMSRCERYLQDGARFMIQAADRDQELAQPRGGTTCLSLDERCLALDLPGGRHELQESARILRRGEECVKPSYEREAHLSSGTASKRRIRPPGASPNSPRA